MEQETNSETCMTKHEETCFLCTCTVVIRTPEDQTHNQMTANEGNSFQVLSALHNDGNVVSVNVTQVQEVMMNQEEEECAVHIKEPKSKGDMQN